MKTRMGIQMLRERGFIWDEVRREIISRCPTLTAA